MTTANVSLAPTSASGLLCNSSPLATAIAVATTEADVHALANVVRGRHAPQPVASWAAEMYGPPQPPVKAVATLLPSHADTTAAAAAAVTGNDDDNSSKGDDTPFSSPPSRPTPDAPPLPPPPQQQVSPRGSVARADSLVEGSVDPSTVTAAAAPPGQPPFAPGSAAGASRLRKNVSWQCGLCGYHVLAMDQDGTPLPFATSAFGNVLPLMCPRCKLSHTSWQPSTPFNEQGDHLNLPTTYSNRYIAPAGAQRPAPLTDTAADDEQSGGGDSGGTRRSQRAMVASLSAVAQQRAAQFRPTRGTGGPGSAAAPSALQRRAYYCGHCNRRLLRVDGNGELVDMDRDADGGIRPIRCPGCGELHSDWVVRPYAVHQ